MLSYNDGNPVTVESILIIIIRISQIIVRRHQLTNARNSYSSIVHRCLIASFYSTISAIIVCFRSIVPQKQSFATPSVLENFADGANLINQHFA